MAVHMQALARPLPTPGIDRAGDDVPASGEWISLRSATTRLLLTSDGRYAKQQGQREATYSGRYSRRGSEIRLVDEFDFVLTGEIAGDTLRIGEYLYRRA